MNYVVSDIKFILILMFFDIVFIIGNIIYYIFNDFYYKIVSVVFLVFVLI